MRRLLLGAVSGLALALAAPAFANDVDVDGQFVVPGAPSIGSFTGVRLPPTGGGGGPNLYTAQGVHFDWQWSHLYTAGAGTGTSTVAPTTPAPLMANYGASNVAVADSPQFTVSYWIRGVPYSATASTAQQTYGMIDIASNVEVSGESAEAFPGHDTVFDHSAGGYSTLRVNLGTGPNGLPATGTCNYTSPPVLGLPQVDTAGWVHVLYSFDGTPASTSKAFALYINGVEVGAGGCTAPSSSVFNVAFSNPNGWGVIANLNAFTTGTSSADIADVYVDMQHSIVCTGTGVSGGFTDCPGPNQIGPAELAKFIDTSGNPVNLGANCQTPTGTKPEICYTGGTSGWAGGNKGSAVGSSTGWVSSNIFAATYGPGANGTPAHQPIVKGVYGEVIGASAASPFTTSSLGVKINPGDLILAYFKLENTSAEPAGGFGISCPTGYNLVTPIVRGTSNVPNNDAICYKFAGVGESDTLSWTYTTAPGKNGTWVTVIIGGVNQTTPFGQVAGTTWGSTSNASTFATPSVTPTGAGQLLLTVMDTWRATSSSYTLSIPANENRLFTGYSSGNGTVFNYELTTNTTPISRTVNLTSGPGGAAQTDSGMVFSILINPN